MKKLMCAAIGLTTLMAGAAAAEDWRWDPLYNLNNGYVTSAGYKFNDPQHRNHFAYYRPGETVPIWFLPKVHEGTEDTYISTIVVGTLISRLDDINTDHAVMKTLGCFKRKIEPMAADDTTFKFSDPLEECRDPTRTMARVVPVARANCKTGDFTSLFGFNYRFTGQPLEGSQPYSVVRWTIINKAIETPLRSNGTVDQNAFYTATLEHYKAMCPGFFEEAERLAGNDSDDPSEGTLAVRNRRPVCNGTADCLRR